MTAELRWGVLGTGGIARKFCGQLPQTAGGVLAAVGSRQMETAQSFADQFGGIPYGSYQQVLADEAVEAVYISLPNSLHAEWSIAALRAGKHVLCEKPLAANQQQAQQMAEVAAETGRVLAEAFMYRHQPAVQKVIELVRSGAIGDLRLIRTNFTFPRVVDAADIRLNAALAGGALMDVGCYCVNFARAIAGSEPTDCHAMSHLRRNADGNGVDDYTVGTLRFGDDVLCTFTCGMSVHSDRTTFISGTTGNIAIPFPWFSTGEILLVSGLEFEDTVLYHPSRKGPYALEAEAFAAACQGTPLVVSLQDSLANMVVLDKLRTIAGVNF